MAQIGESITESIPNLAAKAHFKVLHMLRNIVLSVLLSSLAVQAMAQRQPNMLALLTDQPVALDGQLQEAIWQKTTFHQGFILNFPNDTALAADQTQVAVCYDAQFIYIAAKCRFSPAYKPITNTLRRDFDLSNNDYFGVLLETFNDGLNGYAFMVSPHGVRREDMIADGVILNTSWDNRWAAHTKIYDDHWVVEMRIPLKTIRYRDGTAHMGVNFIRNSLAKNERSAWKRVPINFGMTSLAFTGRLAFESPLNSPGTNISLIPYVTSKVSKQHRDEEGLIDTTATHSWDVGADAKIAISPSLNLDLTINPDFSQVEVDRQVTNLDRFEIFFPERRQFFLENEDLFARFGFTKIRPFFSRRIGIGTDSTTGTIVQNPILFGARLSGKLNPKLRVGLLNIQTAEDPTKGVSPNNYTVAATQYKVFARSNIAAIFVNRSNASDLNDYTRVAGLDYNLQSADGKWWGKFYFHKGFLPGLHGDAITHASFLRYQGSNLAVVWNHEYVDSDYEINDIGFVKRAPHWRIEPSINYSWFFNNSPTINMVRIWSYHNIYTKLNGEIRDYNVENGVVIRFEDRSEASVRVHRDFIELVESPFDPTNTGGKELAIGTDHTFWGMSGNYQSAPGRKWFYSASGRHGRYYNGMITNLGGGFSYIAQPFGSIGLSGEYNNIDLPDEEGFSDAELALIGLDLNISFTKELFLSSFIQYNNQSNNINHNTRLQWRFAPVSDFYLVYTENYTSENLLTKNRAIVAKLTYWLSI